MLSKKHFNILLKEGTDSPSNHTKYIDDKTREETTTLTYYKNFRGIKKPDYIFNVNNQLLIFSN